MLILRIGTDNHPTKIAIGDPGKDDSGSGIVF